MALRGGCDQHQAGDIGADIVFSRAHLLIAAVEGSRLALIHVAQNSIKQDLQRLPSGSNAVFPFQPVDQRDLASRKLERDGFRPGFLVGQTINFAAGRLSTLKLPKPLLLTANGIGVKR